MTVSSKIVFIAAGFAPGAIPLSQSGEAAVLVRDESRILRVTLEAGDAEVAAQSVVALPWDPTLLSLCVNGTLYAEGPVTLAPGDELQLCIPGTWSDPEFAFYVRVEEDADESEGRNDSRSGLDADSAAVEGEPQPTASEDLLAPPVDHRIAELDAFAKWNNFYAHQYNDLTRCRQELVPCGDCPAGGVNGGSGGWPCHSASRILVTHLEGPPPSFGSSGPVSSHRCSCGGAPCQTHWESSRCCACPLLPIGGGPGKKAPTPWSEYAAPFLVARDEKQCEAAAAAQKAHADAATASNPTDEQVLALLQRMRRLEEVLAGTRYL